MTPLIHQDDLVEYSQGYRTAIFCTLDDPEHERPFRLRITIRIDGYKEQSKYLVEVWGNSRWNEVWTLDPLDYPSSRGPKKVALNTARDAATKLYSMAESILLGGE